MDKPPSDKQLLRKANGMHVSAIAFFSAYADHIRETYPGSHTALDMYKSGEMLPTPTLEFIKQVVSQHIIQCQVNRAEESIRKQQAKVNKPKSDKSKSGTSGSGKYAIQIFVKRTSERTGESEIDLWVDHNGVDTFKADLYQNAMRLLDRKMADLCMAQYGTITQVIGENRNLTSRIERSESVARVLRAPKMAVHKSKPTSAPLKNFMRAKNDTCSFSRG